MSDFPVVFDERGLVPVVVVDSLAGGVRMLAYATREALAQTLASGRATFFSRSRSELWEKGRTSGNAVRVQRVLVDCDGDAVIYVGEPEGPSCHTGAESCFFRALDPAGGPPVPSGSQTLLGTLEHVLEQRKGSTVARSYTKALYDGAPAAIAAKIREEAGELARALEGEADDRVVSEAADVLYHVLVGLRWRSIGLRRVLSELARRTGRSGHEEKAAR